MRLSGCLKKLALAALLVTLLAAAAFWWLSREEPADTRWNGAYLQNDGRHLIVAARSEGRVRTYVAETGETELLTPEGDRFDAPPEALGEAELIPVVETFHQFESGDLTLRAKLTLPPEGTGAAPYPVVVIVHGSDDLSAVDRYMYPYLFAPRGIATLVFDKRGTGESEGNYTQNFHVLAGDVMAAVDWVAARPEIDASRIHLAGYSQGGWIAPLAASRLEERSTGPKVRSLLIGYGPMVPIVDEDRWGWVYAFEQKGFTDDPEAMAGAQELHDLTVAIIDRGEDRWGELDRRLDEARDEPWFEALRGSDSMLGAFADVDVPLWMARPYAAWRLRPVDGAPMADRLYDPEPVVAALDVPSLWLLGGEDSSMPTGWTVEKLEAARAQGAPITIRVWPEAEHGIWRFEDTPDGRQYLNLEPDYLETMVDWLRRQSGIGEPVTGPPPLTTTPG